MNEVTMRDCSVPTESGMKKAGKVICGSCIMIGLGVPVLAVILAMLAKVLGYF